MKIGLKLIAANTRTKPHLTMDSCQMSAYLNNSDDVYVSIFVRSVLELKQQKNDGSNFNDKYKHQLID